ncbi:MAG TPA: LysR family transcriptional regulator [Burkholderiaceae bacterium]|nr:LysR family transcriptional regulator [Burkholderiaceae bacterium]
MDLSDLHIFKTVAEEGGIARAAHKLHRVPSNISTRVKQLEQSIGTQLFVRDKQRLFLSPSGEHLLGYADRLLRLSAEAIGAVSKAPPRGLLRLGSLESTAASRLPKILAQYHEAYPEVRVELVTGTNDALTAAVLERRVEAAFVVEVPSSQELAAERLFRERLVIISSLGHAPIRRARDIDGDSVIAFPNGCAYRRVLQHWLGPARVASVRVLELSSYHAIIACVASGTGVALVPESVLDTVQHATVARHPLPKVHGQVTTPLIWRAADASAALLALRKVATAAARVAR